MKHLLASAVLCLFAHQLGFSQEQEMPRRSCRECVIAKTYQPASNSNVLLLKLMTVADVTQGNMYFSLATSSRSNDAGFKKVVSLRITFIAKQLVEAKDPILRAQADDSAINFGRLAHSHTDTAADLKISGYGGLANSADVLKLGQGKEVDMTFDGIKFRLTDEHKAAILDFLVYSEGEAGDANRAPQLKTRVSPLSRCLTGSEKNTL
jgi:hypothetical protein